MYPCIDSIFQILGHSEYHCVPLPLSEGCLRSQLITSKPKCGSFCSSDFSVWTPLGTMSRPPLPPQTPWQHLIWWTVPQHALTVLSGGVCLYRTSCQEHLFLCVPPDLKGWWSELAEFWRYSPKVPVSGYSIKYRSTSWCERTLQLELKLLMSLP